MCFAVSKGRLSYALAEAAYKVGDGGEVKIEGYFGDGQIGIGKLTFGFVHHFIADVLLGADAGGRSYNLIQIVGGNAEFVGVELNGVLLLEVGAYHFYEFA